MKIPEKFKRILDTNQALHSIILDIVTSFQAVFEDNKLFFFEEYTDHGIKHIESVLASAEFIIADDSFDNMTAKDVAVLILSIILHDIGMHTEYATFVALLDGSMMLIKPALITKHGANYGRIIWQKPNGSVHNKKETYSVMSSNLTTSPT